MAASKEQHCGNCGAYITVDNEGGECHRNAPMAQMDGAMRNIKEIQTSWPYVEGTDWCSQWIEETNKEEVEEE